ncbi:MAG TPA: aspartate aminotransferase family protein [Acidimicrobiales bacterium]|nr:aspartate aminotransferase family protein [Acidimicrobiales bacterium]
MTFDLRTVTEERSSETFALHQRYLNGKLAEVLRTIGFDRSYVRGEGCYLYDAEGNEYLDLLSGFGVFALGRSHPAVKAALHDAIDADLPNLVQMDCALLPGLLAEQLVARCHPGIQRAFFCNSGTEAVESAIKFARRATGRSRVLYCQHAFHGLSTGSLALNGGREFRDGFGPLLPGCDAVPLGDLGALAAELRRGDVAAFVFEPIQGKGVYEAPAEYWREAEALCRRHGALLVADEVQTGLGRTGRFFCHEHWDLRPDVITVSKALSGGYVPVGAMLCTERVWASVYRSMDRAVVHSSTFGSNLLAMVAGLATLAAFDDEDIVDRARRTGEHFAKALQPLVDRYELLQEVRGKGLMIGLEFGAPASRRLRVGWNALERVRPGLFSQLVVVPLFQRHRILTQVAADNINVIKLLPPLVAGDEEVERFVDAFVDVLDDAHAGSGFYVDFGRTMARGALRRRG